MSTGRAIVYSNGSAPPIRNCDDVDVVEASTSEAEDIHIHIRKSG